MPQEGDMTDENDAPVDEPQEHDEQPENGQEPEPDESGQEPDESGYDPEKAREKIRKINSENRNLRKRAADAEAKAQEAEGKGERVSELEAENLRLRIAVKHGLPEQLVKRLSGSTEEEMLQDAEELMELFGSKKPPTRQPRESLRSPSDPSGNAEIDVQKVVDRVFEN